MSSVHDSRRRRAEHVIEYFMLHLTSKSGHGMTVAIAMIGVIVLAGSQSRVEAEPPAGAKADASSRCNIVIYLIDTLRADRLGAYGYMRRSTSPNIDKLARQGVLFEQAYAPAPWTLPSVASLVTSTYPCEHGMLDNRHKLGQALDPLAARLKRLGFITLGLYANALVGPSYGFDRGFERLDPVEMITGRHVEALLPPDADKPFFLYIHNIEPHNPYAFAPVHTRGFRDISTATRLDIQRRCMEYRRTTRVDFADQRPLGATDNTAEQDRRLAALTALRGDYRELYDASVRQADSNLASVIDVLKRRNLWDNTLFILLSDHGEEMNEHGGWLHDQSVYEELMRVPLIVSFPSGRYAGKRVKDVVSLVDILPTIFDYLDASEMSSGARGRVLTPLIRGEMSGATFEPLIPGMRWNTKKYYRPWKLTRGDINVVVRLGRWKGVWNAEPKSLELYDLAVDPGEQNNQARANPDLAERLGAAARRWLKQCDTRAVTAPPENAMPDDDTVENLRALGYID